MFKPGLTRVALSAKWHVHIGTSDKRCAVLRGSSKRETGVLLAKLADSTELFNLLTLRDQRHYVLERAAQKGPLQRSNDYNFLLVGSHFCKLNDVHEKLALVDTNHVVFAPGVRKICA